MTDATDFVIWGALGHAKVLADAIEARGGRLVALFDNDPAVRSFRDGVPLYHGDDGFRQWASGSRVSGPTAAAVAIGGRRGPDRRAVGARLAEAGLEVPPVVHPRGFVASTAILGRGCHVLAQAVVAADVRLGEFCIINHAASIDHECELASGVHVAPGAVLCGCVRVGEDAMIGAGAVVLPRVTIGREATVGAGAVVTRDVGPGEIVIGIPARARGACDD